MGLGLNTELQKKLYEFPLWGDDWWLSLLPIKATGGVYTSASATLLGSTSKAVSIYGNYRPDNIISSGLGMNIAGGVISASLAIDDTRITLSQKYEDSISTSGSLKVNLTKAEAGIEFSQTFMEKMVLIL